MTEEEVIKWIVMSAIGLAVWFLKRNIDNTDKKINEINLHMKDMDFDIHKMKRDYLHRDDFREFKNELREMFGELKADIKELKQND